MGHRLTTLVLALRLSVALLPAIGLLALGIVVDGLAGTSPVAALSFLVIGVTLGTVVMCLTVIKSFPQPARPKEEQPADGNGNAGAAGNAT